VFANLPHYCHAIHRRASAFAVNGLVATAISAAGAQPPASSRTAPPPPDVYLASVKVERETPTIGTPLNITARPGYDNQPSFTSDDKGVYFTSVRDDAQADIYRYDIATGRTTRVTTTAPESEYSATEIDDGRAISVVRVERDSTQRLWRFPLNGSAPSVILERVRPVGYHAWADDHTLALFVLGSPNSLQLADARSGSSDTIATGIGRSLHRIPGTSRISFVRKVAATEWWIESLDPATRTTTRLVRLPENVEDYAWFPNGAIICGSDSRLLWWSGKIGDDWRQIADLSSAGVRGITRLAVSAHGDRLALVADGK
jgi:dipeptidyl aminopeptidase/acylaminoacyl peptidase